MRRKTTLPRYAGLPLAAVGCIILAAGGLRAEEMSPLLQRSDPTMIVGAGECAQCHKLEEAAWKESKHSLIFAAFHRQPETAEISQAFGERSIKRNNSCTLCHYTMQLPAGRTRPKAISSISCESCHGAARDWVNVHNDYGEYTKDTEPPAHKKKRLADSVAAGMLNPNDLYGIAQNCFECHTVPHERLVNTTKHLAGSEFELVAWSQGEIRHNFLHSNEENAKPPREELHILYVLGRALDLEYGIRGLAESTSNDTYAKAMKARTIKAFNQIVKIKKQGVDIPELVEMLDVVPREFSYDTRAPYMEVANKIRAAARRIEKNRDTYRAKLAKVDALLPTKVVGTAYGN